jgi:hypothetical protein
VDALPTIRASRAAGEIRPEAVRGSLDRVLLILAALALALVSWANFGLLAHWPWSSARLAMMLRPAYGLPLYPAPATPNLNDWMYGPVGSIAYLPAALAADPLGALHVATVLNALYFLLPLVALFMLAARVVGRATASWGFLFGLVATLMPMGVWYNAAVLQVDNVAIGFGVLSCMALVLGRGWEAAVLCVLAIGTKQIAAPLVVAQLLFVAWSDGVSRAAKYGVRLALAFVVAAGVGVALFGFEPLWFNLVVIPSKYPFDFSRLTGELPFALSTTWWILPVAALGWKFLPLRRDAGPALRLAWLLLLAAVVLLPLGIVAVSKYGGHQNSIHSLAYGILGGALLVTLLAGQEHQAFTRFARVALTCAVFGLVALKLHRVQVNGYLGPGWAGLRHREAFEFAQARPGQVYFPLNPLVTLFAEGREYPFEGCYNELTVTHRAPPPASIRAVFPKELGFVVYHDAESPTGELDPVFPDFTQIRRNGEWTIRVPAANRP